MYFSIRNNPMIVMLNGDCIINIEFKYFNSCRKILSGGDTLHLNGSWDWTAEVVGRMHAQGITRLVLAKAAGLSNTYLSAVLHKKRGDDRTRRRIVSALERLSENKVEKEEG